MPASSPKPNFFIVGAAKAGTTSVYNYLAAHPEVFLSPIKEPNHFGSDILLEHQRPQEKERLAAQHIDSFLSENSGQRLHRAFIKDESVYSRLFEKAGDAKAIGEASVSYLYSADAAQQLYAYNPEARIIIVLRDPAERAYSHYLMDLRLGITKSDFATALHADSAIPQRYWGAASLYFELGLYANQVTRYLEAFPRNQVLIFLQEELRNDPNACIKRLYEFLEVDSSFLPDLSQKHNTALVPRNALAQKIAALGGLKVMLRKLIKGTSLHRKLKSSLMQKPEKSEADKATIALLRARYSADIRKLALLIEKDLSPWL